LFDQLDGLNKRIKELELRIHAWHKNNKTSKRLTSIPGIGPLTASAIVASIGTAGNFGTARSFAAWLGSPHANILLAGNKCWVGFPNVVMVISASSWYMAHVPWCG